MDASAEKLEGGTDFTGETFALENLRHTAFSLLVPICSTRPVDVAASFGGEGLRANKSSQL